MELAKPALDVGLVVNDLEPALTFWQTQAHVPFDEMLPLGGGRRQHRHRIGESILKINHSREPAAPAPPAGYRLLTLASDRVGAPTVLSDPEGNRVALVPPGYNDITQLELLLVVGDLKAHRDFYGNALGLEEVAEDVFGAGVSRVRLQRATDGVTSHPDMNAPGYRYITLQVFDVRSAHATVLERGGVEGRKPVKLGDVAHISFVMDPDGNPIELSQRKSITGTLD